MEIIFQRFVNRFHKYRMLLIDTFNDTRNWYKEIQEIECIASRIFLILFLSCIYVIAILLFLVLSCIAVTYYTIKDVIRYHWFQLKTSKFKSHLSEIYTSDFVADILCRILKENAHLFELSAPSSIADIIPTQYTVQNTENGYPYYKFIIRHLSNIHIDIADLETFLDLKISQHLQTHCSNYPIVYRGLPIVKVFRIENCLYHPNCLAISIMIIDHDGKWNYINQLLNAQNDVAPMVNLCDEDF